MESLEFLLVVVPLSIVVSTLAVMVYYYAHKEEINHRKNTKLIQSFVEKRVKQQAAIKSELDHIEILYNNGSINESIYKRLQNVIMMTQERQRFEAMMTLNPKEETNKETETSPENQRLEKEQFLWLHNEVAGEGEDQGVTEVKEETGKPQKRKRAKSAKTRKKKKKETEIGMVSNPNAAESVREDLPLPPT
jgi:hypothetical protein